MVFDDSLYLHGLNLLPQFGPGRLMRMANGFENYKQAFEAKKSLLVNAGIEPEVAEKFLALRDEINLEQEQEKLEREGIKILAYNSANYPRLLLEIPKLPVILYYKGTMDQPDELCVAVVGTRQITAYGRVAVSQLTEPLVDAGVVVVSGMAFGVDSAAHEIAIKKGRRTIAVLGGGLDEKSLYPKHHALLAKRIVDAGGALLAEYPIGTPNFKQNFVARNRIISGLCPATLVIECDLQSGTLITAKHALDQNRQLYAVPGPIYSPQSQGPNNLLKMGAKPVTSANDILEDLNLKTLPQQQAARNLLGDSREETVLLRLIGFDPVVINQLIKTSGLEASAVTSALTFLEMKGRVKNLGGQQYVLAR